MDTEKLFEIDYPSQEFSQQPQIEKKYGSVQIKFDYETETGEYAWTGITFFDVISYKVTSQIATPKSKIVAYDKVCILNNSDWLNEIRKDYRGEKQFDFKHYIIFFEDFGIYEFVANHVSKGLIE